MNEDRNDPKIEALLKNWRTVPPKAAQRFTDGVMHKVHALPTPRSWWRDLLDVRSFTLRFRPAMALAALFILGVGLGYFLRPSVPETGNLLVTNEALPTAEPAAGDKPSDNKQYVVKFVYMDPNAKSVQVMGDFTQWQQTPLTRQAGGLWTITLPLTEGQYNYQFLIDGQKLVTDPTAPEEADDGFGHVDSVLRL